MTPSIEIDSDVMEHLKSHAEPFVDTPNSVLRRLLGVDSAPADGDSQGADAKPRPEPRTNSPRPASRRRDKRRTRAPSGALLPESEYFLPLLRVLDAAGGELPYRDVVEAVGREIEDRLKPADYDELASGGVRWQSRLQFVRLRLIERGDMDRDAPRGIWRISHAGRETLKNGVTHEQ